MQDVLKQSYNVFKKKIDEKKNPIRKKLFSIQTSKSQYV